MSSISNLFIQNNPWEPFVQQLVQLESRQKLLLQQQQSTQKERKTAVGEISSAVSKFKNLLNELTAASNKALNPFTSSTSNDKVVKIDSVAGANNPAVYDITVHRVATNDIALSQTLSAEGSELAAMESGAITLTIGEQTETITIDTDGKNNREVLEALSTQINELFGGQASASVFQTNSNEIQFSVKSLETGFDNRVQFSDESGALTQLTMSHLVPEENLDARFTIDGVVFERSNNTVDDAIEGITFTLLRPSEDTERMSITRDIDKARKNIDDFISSFNNMNKTIRDRTFLDAENDRRGALQTVRSVRNLTINMRQISLLPSDNASEGDIARLSDLGISLEKDGTMKITDADKLKEMLTDRPDDVMSFFTSEDSPIAKMSELAESYTKGKSGIFDSITKGLDDRIDSLGRRIKIQEKYLTKYEERQRAEFNKLQQVIDQGNQQYQQIMTFQSLLRY